MRGLGCSRLQLEDVRWRLLRRRLFAEATEPELATYKARPATALRSDVSPDGGFSEEELRQELRSLLAEVMPLIEEFVVTVCRHRE